MCQRRIRELQHKQPIKYIDMTKVTSGITYITKYVSRCTSISGNMKQYKKYIAANRARQHHSTLETVVTTTMAARPGLPQMYLAKRPLRTHGMLRAERSEPPSDRHRQ